MRSEAFLVCRVRQCDAHCVRLLLRTRFSPISSTQLPDSSVAIWKGRCALFLIQFSWVLPNISVQLLLLVALATNKNFVKQRVLNMQEGIVQILTHSFQRYFSSYFEWIRVAEGRRP